MIQEYDISMIMMPYHKDGKNNNHYHKIFDH